MPTPSYMPIKFALGLYSTKGKVLYQKYTHETLSFYGKPFPSSFRLVLTPLLSVSYPFICCASRRQLSEIIINTPDSFGPISQSEIGHSHSLRVSLCHTHVYVHALFL